MHYARLKTYIGDARPVGITLRKQAVHASWCWPHAVVWSSDATIPTKPAKSDHPSRVSRQRQSADVDFGFSIGEHVGDNPARAGGHGPTKCTVACRNVQIGVGVGVGVDDPPLVPLEPELLELLPLVPLPEELLPLVSLSDADASRRTVTAPPVAVLSERATLAAVIKETDRSRPASDNGMVPVSVRVTAS